MGKGFVFVLVAMLATFATAQKRDENEIVRVPNGDRNMVAAIAKAQATLDEFLSVWRARPPGTSSYRLKVGVKDGVNSEHFWIQPFRITPEGFEGRLANEPRLVKNLREGQEIKFTRAEISDWGYVRDGKQVGSFTVCAMFKSAPKEQADYYRKNYGFECQP
jgi:uncharacterized protein YegJ (DUF2314 family)